MFKRGFVGLLSVLLCVSCQPSSNDLNANLGTGIINGRDLKAGEPLTRSVVAIWDVHDKAICTGSLLPNNVIITAAHCLTGRPAALRVIFSLEPLDIIDSREPDVILESTRRVTSYKVHEDHEETQEDDLDQNDIGVLKFQGTVPEGYAPATLLSDIEELQVGREATVVGYGVNHVEEKDIDVKKIPHDKLEEMIEMGYVTCDEKMIHCMEIDMSGDGILRVAHAPIEALHETEVRLDEKKQGTCSGDSGGPAYLEKNGVLYLFGITSRGNLFCDEDGLYTNILAHKAWLERALKAL